MSRWWLAAAAPLLLVAGCSSSPSTTATPATAPSISPTVTAAAITTTPPSQLIGTWILHTTGLEDGSAVVFGDNTNTEVPETFSVVYPTCQAWGDWHATTAGLFIGMTSSAKGSCESYLAPDFSPAFGTPPSIEKARSFGQLKGQLVLVAANGDITARLTPATKPVRDPNTISGTIPFPTVSPQTAAVLDAPPSRPAGLVPASKDHLLGAWVPEPTGNPRQGNGSLQFGPETWRASDGCNGIAGLWTVDPSGGQFLATRTGMSLVGCSPSDSRGPAVAGATYAGFDGSVLVFTDAKGAVIGRFLRSSAAPTNSPR